MRKAFFIPALFAALFLSACATTIRSDVTRFNELPTPKGETFIIMAKTPGMVGGLEFGRYAALVSEQLVAEGYRPAGEGTPDLIVELDFGISGPLEEGYSARPAPYFGFSYFGRVYPYGYPVYDPYYPYYNPYYAYTPYASFYHWRRERLAFLYDTSDYKRIVYERSFMMSIKENSGGYVFEGRALSIGRSNDLPKVVPFLIDALFTDFPGEDGSTIRVSVTEDD